MKKFGGFIPGIRPGGPPPTTCDYVLSRITLPGSIYLGVDRGPPDLFLRSTGTVPDQNLPFGGTRC